MTPSNGYIRSGCAAKAVVKVLNSEVYNIAGGSALAAYLWRASDESRFDGDHQIRRRDSRRQALTSAHHWQARRVCNLF